jgi:hypothetical protein
LVPWTPAPPAEHLATFRWLFPESQMPPNKLHFWVLFLATLQERNGEGLAARANYAWLQSALLRQQASGRVLEQTEEGLRRAPVALSMEGSPADGWVTVDSKTCTHPGEVTASDGHPSCLSTMQIIQVQEKQAFIRVPGVRGSGRSS